MTDGRISAVHVIRGASCGATWEAAERIRGLSPEEAAVRIGLEVQFFCRADPSGWDPIHGRSPVHFAGEVHKSALAKAIQSTRERDQNLHDRHPASQLPAEDPT
jgi:hypothetical protein